MAEKISSDQSKPASKSQGNANPDINTAAKATKVNESTSPQNVGSADIFLLEKLFPDAHEVFRASSMPNPNDPECLVAIDTNALLLPYSVGKGDLKSLGDVYSKIAAQGRLFLPERVAREFIRNRDRKLAEMVQAIGDIRSKINIGLVSRI